MVKDYDKAPESTDEYVYFLTHEEYIENKDSFIERLPKNVPDKALCFTYYAFEENSNLSNDELENFSYHITNGYRESYKYNSDRKMKPYYPFKNVVWYSTDEGCSYVVEPTEDNADFFVGNFETKIYSDYFHLYIRNLFESYSLLKYSMEITETTSCNYKEYLKGKQYRKLLKLHTKINVFMCKVVTTSVSYVSHQTDFNSYLSEALHIKENIDTITIGLDTLNSLQKEVENDKLSTTFNFLSIIQGIFVLSYIFDLIELFIPSVNRPDTIIDLFMNFKVESIIFTVIASIIMVIEASALKSIIKNNIDRYKG